MWSFQLLADGVSSGRKNIASPSACWALFHYKSQEGTDGTEARNEVARNEVARIACCTLPTFGQLPKGRKPELIL